MKTEPRIEDDSMPQRNCEAKDEMNLAEFPLCALAHRLRPGVKTLHFEDRIPDKSAGKTITRQVTVTGSDAYGLPTGKDDEVLLGLIQLTRLRGFADRKVLFTRHELIRMLGWRDDSKSYARVEASLNRWTGVTLYYNNAWRNKERKSWMSEKFHILDNVWLCHRGEASPDVGLPSNGAPMSAFVWNEVAFRSFTQGNLKGIDFEFYKSLQSAVSKRLYRFLDKRFWHRNRLQFELRELCCEHVGLSRGYDTANFKRKLMSGVSELEARGFLTSLATQQRFFKVRRGEWNVTFERATDGPAKVQPILMGQADLWIQPLIERGVQASVAATLSATHPAERIRRQLQKFDQLMMREARKVLRNPAGFLVASINGDYAASGCVTASEKNERRTCGKHRQVVPITGISQREDSKSHALRTISEQFWGSLPAPERIRCELEAISQGNTIQRDLLERGGAFAATARSALLEAYAIKHATKRH